MRALCFGEMVREQDGAYEGGGSPLLLAAHLSRLDCQAFLYSRLGADENGAWLRSEAARLNVDVSHVQTDRSHPTPTASISHRTGMPAYTFSGTAHEHICADNEQTERINRMRFDVLCVQTLAQCFPNPALAFGRLLEEVESREVFYGLSLREKYYGKKAFDSAFRAATIVGLNEEELKVVSTILYGRMMKPQEFCEEVSRAFAVPVIFILHTGGCTVCHAGTFEEAVVAGRKSFSPAPRNEAFAASFLTSFCRGTSALDSATHALGYALETPPGWRSFTPPSASL